MKQTRTPGVGTRKEEHATGSQPMLSQQQPSVQQSTDHELVTDSLASEHEQTNNMLVAGEMRAFGKNSDSIFRELDVIRRQQQSLAIKHIALENLPDEEMPLSDSKSHSKEAFQRNADLFSKKKQDLDNLMNNLNDLVGKLEDLSHSIEAPSKGKKQKLHDG